MRAVVNDSICSEYMLRKPETNWTSTEEMKKKLTCVDLTKNTPIPEGGIPVISDGKTAYLDTSDNHCAVFGASGFKKSTSVFMPAIYCLARAGESMVIHDPKGELYTRTAEYLKTQDYRIIVLNFRDYNGDGYNPLRYPAKLWKEGKLDKAASATNDLNSALAQKQESSKNIDNFWPTMGKSTNSGVLPLMYDSYDLDDINFLSLSDYYTERTAEYLKDYVNDSGINNAPMTNLRNVLSAPEKTRQSILVTAASFVQPFTQSDKLIRMLSHSTFELEDIANEKTALFIITDDTTTVCNSIVGILISQLITVLADKAFHSENGRLKTRVNFILDEFCSLPIPGIEQALATLRSRNIRFYLCIQSIDALSSLYPHYEGILTNCATTLFLGSTEMNLLERISKRCGDTEKTHSGRIEPLISVPELMTLKKSWDYKEALYFNLAESVRYCTTLPAIEQYYGFTNYKKSKLPDITHPKVNGYTFRDLLRDISNKKAKEPFTEPKKPVKESKRKIPPNREAILGKSIQTELELKFQELFGSSSQED